jgi:hypothetical protein
MDRRTRHVGYWLLLFGVSGSLGTFCGCGGKDIPSASIASAPESVILGTWDGRLVLTNEGDRNIVGSPEMTRSRNIAESSEFRFEYRDNGVFCMSVRSQIPGQGAHSKEVEGTWKILKETGNDVRLEVEYETGKKESLHLNIIDEDHIENSTPDELKGFTLKMKRVGK